MVHNLLQFVDLVVYVEGWHLLDVILSLDSLYSQTTL